VDVTVSVALRRREKNKKISVLRRGKKRNGRCKRREGKGKRGNPRGQRIPSPWEKGVTRKRIRGRREKGLVGGVVVVHGGGLKKGRSSVPRWDKKGGSDGTTEPAAPGKKRGGYDGSCQRGGGASILEKKKKTEGSI